MRPDIEGDRFTSSEMKNAEMLIMKTRAVENYQKVYRDLEKKRVIMKKTFRKKDFLMTEFPKSGKWKLVNENKEIAGYECNKATRIDGEQKIEAWYTTEIPIASGPSVYGDLPGLILEVNINGKNESFVAEIVDLGPDFSDEIVAPSKGKKVTPVQFDEIVRMKKEELERMRERDHDDEERVSEEGAHREH